MEEQLRNEVEIMQDPTTGLWSWETKVFCCEEFNAEDEAINSFEKFLTALRNFWKEG